MKRPRIARRLKHRAAVLRLQSTVSDGAPSYDWTTVIPNLQCLLDLAYMRRGKDQAWVQEAGRAPDRNGVLFVEPGTGIRSGDRIRITSPADMVGTYVLDGAIDLATADGQLNHLEIGVTEVPSPARPEE
jgi:hypothetical protein